MKCRRNKPSGKTLQVFFLFVALAGFLAAVAPQAQEVLRIRLDKPIHPITAEYVVQAVGTANARGAAIILLQIDTPGGYVTSVEKIQRAILESKIPVVAYIAPAGGRAASGGAFVALACDAIAMAPGTSIGSAHPVSGLPIPLPTQPPAGVPGQQGKDTPAQAKEAEVGMEKMVNDLAAHMRSIAANRGRNAELAEKMVRESISLTEQEALKGGVIEVVAKNEGSPQVELWFDAQSGLIVRVMRYAETPIGRNPTEINYADFRAADGVTIPFRWTVARPSGRFTVQLEESKQNAPVDAKSFVKPAPGPPS